MQRWRGSDRLPALDVAESGACRVLDPGGVFASLSHSGDRVVCAVAALPVGVDIERLDRPRDHLAVAGTVHGAAQRQALLALAPDERARHFLTLWTLKEAWLKARESGLDFAAMRSLAFDDDPDGDLATAEDGGFMLALAVVPALPPAIVSSPALSWRRCRTRRVAPD
ncbi:4'-phosphopantetheinyl transferase family protein [Roseateles chitinivorans]|uniref:4'-phosphopantetheinyl transferase family protein n=1 Tax=Roseateles chitinivorans TaxID=2917965 RepID=UPI003D6717AA